VRLLLVADVSPVAVLGGGERVLREHALRLQKRGHEVTVLCRAPRPDAPDAVRLDGLVQSHDELGAVRKRLTPNGQRTEEKSENHNQL